MRQPPETDIDEALDALDWMPLPVVEEMRYTLSKAMRSSAQTRASHAERQATEWTPIQLALLYILYITSDEHLAAQMTAPSVH
jgi:hypothetical protein